jgi:hypothetical protein
MPKNKRGRPLEWPSAWAEFSALVGGPAALRDALGYSSATTVPDKIHSRSPWTKADHLLLAVICREKGFDVARLFPA